MVTESELVVILRTQGGAVVDAQIKKVQQSSKRLENQSKRLETQNKKTTATTSKFSDSLRRTAQSVALLQGPLGPIAGRITSLNQIVSNGATVAAAFAVSLTAMAAAFGKSATAAGKFERQMFTINAILETTGATSGQTLESIEALSREIGISTLASTSQVREAAAQLLTFRSIAGDTFEQTLRLAQDLATLGFGSITSSTQQLAKALEDPITGITSLRRVGVIFNETQQETIKLLAETGAKAQAQQLILGELEKQVGGAGRGSARGLSGAFDTLGERVQFFFEELGKSGPAEAAARAITSLANAVEKLTDNLPALLKDLKSLSNILLTIGAFLATNKLIQLLLPVIATIGRFGKVSLVALGNFQGLGKILAGLGVILTRFNPTTVALAGAFGVLSTQVDSVFEALRALDASLTVLFNGFRIGIIKINGFGRALVQAFKNAFSSAAKIVDAFGQDLADFFKNPLGGFQGESLSKAFAEAFVIPDDVIRDTEQKVQAIVDETVKAINEIAGVVQQELPDAVEDGLDKAKNSFDNFNEQIGESFKTLGKDIRSTFSDFFFDIFNEGKISFDKLFDSIRTSFARLASNLITQQFTAALAAPFLGQNAIGGLRGRAFGSGLFGGPTTGQGGIGAGAIGGASAGLSGLLGGFTTPFLSGSSIANLAGGVQDLFGLGQGGFANIAQGLQNFTPLAGIAGFGGSLVSSALGFEGTGASIGGTIGSIGGTFLGGAPGAFIGNIIGSAIGSLFGGGQPNPAATFGANIGATGLPEDINLLSKNLGTEFPQQLLETITPAIQRLIELGINVAGQQITGGVETTIDRGGFFGFGRSVKDPAFEGTRFDPENQQEANDALSAFIVLLAQTADGLNANVATALQNIITEGRTVDEILADLQFAATFDKLFDTIPVLTQLEAELITFNQILDDAQETAKRLGLEEQILIDGREKAIRQLRESFNKDVQNQILAFTDPTAGQLQQLEAAFAEIRRNAIVSGGDLLAVEQLFALERQDILEQTLEAQRSAIVSNFERIVDDIEDLQRSLRLDPQLSGVSRLELAQRSDEELIDLAARVAAGDPTVFEDLGDVSRQTLTALLDFFGPTAEFLERVAQVDTILEDAKILAANTLTTEQQILVESSAQTQILLDLLDATSQEFQEIAGIPRSQLLRPGETADILLEVNKLNGLLREQVRFAKVAASNGEFRFDDPARIGESFADFVRAGDTEAGQRFIDTIEALGGFTAKQKEIFGFQNGTGGKTFSGLALVGEQGPELVNFGQPAQIFSNGQSRAIMEGGESSTEEIRSLREDVDILLQTLIQSTREQTNVITELKDEIMVTNNG